MADDFAIRERLQTVVAGHEEIDGFRAWLAKETWNLEPGDSGTALSARIKLTLAEYDRGDLDHETLMLELKRLATLVWSGLEPPFASSAANSTHRIGSLNYQTRSTPSVSV